MITAKAFSGKHYAVLGLARSGLATVRALLASGARVTAWDDREEARDALLSPSPGGEGRGEGFELLNGLSNAEHPHPTLSLQGEGLSIGDFTASDLTRFDSIVVTPGLPLNRHPIAAAAKAAGVEIIGDIELFARARAELPPHRVVGITGTNGKSTTTALIHHILKTAGVPTTMGGNIGLPILSQDPLPEGGVYVLELSSYQIDLTQSLDCDVAVLLNITPDHLDRYESFEAYAASKMRLYDMQTYPHVSIVAGATFRSATFDRKRFFSLPTVRSAATDEHDPSILGSAVYDGIAECDGTVFARQVDWPSLQGPHNAQNASVAIEVTSQLGLSTDQIAEGLRTFTGLPHRMERLREMDGVLFVNDSKATNAEAAAPALAAYPRIRWIVGGQAKTEELGETAKSLGHVVKAYTIGEAGPMFAALLRAAGVEVAECETLEKATKCAAEDSQAGDTVLLSPAAASFDQFRDFEDRGDAFRRLVGGL